MEINELFSLMMPLCSIEPLTIGTHDRGILIAERYKLSVYDAMIVAAALIGGCETLYSEDMQNGLLIDNQLRICNPYLFLQDTMNKFAAFPENRQRSKLTVTY